MGHWVMGHGSLGSLKSLGQLGHGSRPLDPVTQSLGHWVTGLQGHGSHWPHKSMGHGSHTGSLGHWVMGHACNGSDGSWVT